MTQRYTVSISRITYDDNTGKILGSEVLAEMHGAHAYEVSPALKQLAKKIHESPPPVVLEGQGVML